MFDVLNILSVSELWWIVAMAYGLRVTGKLSVSKSAMLAVGVWLLLAFFRSAYLV